MFLRAILIASLKQKIFLITHVSKSTFFQNVSIASDCVKIIVSAFHIFNKLLTVLSNISTTIVTKNTQMNSRFIHVNYSNLIINFPPGLSVFKNFPKSCFLSVMCRIVSRLQKHCRIKINLKSYGNFFKPVNYIIKIVRILHG